MMSTRRPFVAVVLVCGLSFLSSHRLQSQQSATPTPQAQGQDVDPLKRERSDQEKFKARKAYQGEIHGAFKTWLEQDATYIISDEERKAFKNLSNDEEREAFIENFWLRRNPNPDSPENEFRDEHYRRIQYANDRLQDELGEEGRAPASIGYVPELLSLITLDEAVAEMSRP